MHEGVDRLDHPRIGEACSLGRRSWFGRMCFHSRWCARLCAICQIFGGCSFGTFFVPFSGEHGAVATRRAWISKAGLSHGSSRAGGGESSHHFSDLSVPAAQRAEVSKACEQPTGGVVEGCCKEARSGE